MVISFASYVLAQLPQSWCLKALNVPVRIQSVQSAERFVFGIRTIYGIQIFYVKVTPVKISPGRCKIIGV